MAKLILKRLKVGARISLGWSKRGQVLLLLLEKNTLLGPLDETILMLLMDNDSNATGSFIIIKPYCT
jgi:hypothetical protein